MNFPADTIQFVMAVSEEIPLIVSWPAGTVAFFDGGYLYAQLVIKPICAIYKSLSNLLRSHFNEPLSFYY